jgi:hypothetical protein
MFLDLGTRRAEGSASRPGGFIPLGKTRYSLYRRFGGLQGRSGQVRKISPPPIRSPDRVAHSQSLYRLSYPGLFGIEKLQIKMHTHARSHHRTHISTHQIGSAYMRGWVSRSPQCIVLKQYNIYFGLYCSNIFPYNHPYFQPTQPTETQISACLGKTRNQM